MDELVASIRNTKRPNQSQTNRAVRLSSTDPCTLQLRKDREIPCDYKKNALRTEQRSVLRNIYKYEYKVSAHNYLTIKGKDSKIISPVFAKRKAAYAPNNVVYAD